MARAGEAIASLATSFDIVGLARYSHDIKMPADHICCPGVIVNSGPLLLHM
ncbi:hypothetical protein [Peribacillus frigoritolerans]|uniref:hypothetical protein n=1 Tax=Peribacillus frigoritolerans TaxID=450367 RepID=UPI00207A06BF|nr:hypothetical protein [Peribacillus frigoritolerans]USK75002.1 hypothetical protein LIT31_25275 [Peribacillus frigoritolerans]